MVNRATLIGNLGKDVELRHTNAGQAVANLRVATSRSWLDKASGQKKEETEWFDVEVWGKAAEACAQYLAKGRQVYVEGRFKTERYTDKATGAEKYRTKVIADDVKFIGGKSRADGAADHAPADDGNQGGGFDGPDSIPF